MNCKSKVESIYILPSTYNLLHSEEWRIFNIFPLHLTWLENRKINVYHHVKLSCNNFSICVFWNDYRNTVDIYILKTFVVRRILLTLVNVVAWFLVSHMWSPFGAFLLFCIAEKCPTNNGGCILLQMAVEYCSVLTTAVLN